MNRYYEFIHDCNLWIFQTTFTAIHEQKQSINIFIKFKLGGTMKRIIFLIIVFPIISFYQCAPNGTNAESTSTVQLADLRCEYSVNPLGIDVYFV